MPQEEQVDEVQAIFPAKTSESSLEKDVKLFIQKEDDQEETFELPTFLQKSSQGSLKHKFGETAFATLNSCPENPTVEHHLYHDPFEEMMLVSHSSMQILLLLPTLSIKNFWRKTSWRNGQME